MAFRLGALWLLLLTCSAYAQQQVWGQCGGIGWQVPLLSLMCVRPLTSEFHQDGPDDVCFRLCLHRAE